MFEIKQSFAKYRKCFANVLQNIKFVQSPKPFRHGHIKLLHQNIKKKRTRHHSRLLLCPSRHNPLCSDPLHHPRKSLGQRKIHHQPKSQIRQHLHPPGSPANHRPLKRNRASCLCQIQCGQPKLPEKMVTGHHRPIHRRTNPSPHRNLKTRNTKRIHRPLHPRNGIRQA